jgi:hypothetical protein
LLTDENILSLAAIVDYTKVESVTFETETGILKAGLVIIPSKIAIE